MTAAGQALGGRTGPGHVPSVSKEAIQRDTRAVPTVEHIRGQVSVCEVGLGDVIRAGLSVTVVPPPVSGCAWRMFHASLKRLTSCSAWGLPRSMGRRKELRLSICVGLRISNCGVGTTKRNACAPRGQ